MRVKQLKLTNFRGIQNLTLDFPAKGPTVLIGVNGAGKSSILDGLAMTIAQRIQFLRGNDLTHPEKLHRLDLKTFQADDVRRGSQEMQLEMVLLHHNPISHLDERFQFSLTIPAKTLAFSSESFGDEEQAFLHSPNPKASLPCFVYYPVNRVVSPTPLTEAEDEQTAFEQFSIHELALTAPHINFQAFFTWFKKQEDLENELRLNDNPDYRDFQLQAIRQAIVSLLPDFSNLRVRRSPLRLTIAKQGQDLTLSQLSDGEKCLLAMVGDLALRLAIWNPGLADPLQGEGIVLIDEIELHLHPSWQRLIIPALTRTFPNCQFILTTHSPQILGEVKGQIYKLEATADGIIAEAHQTFGKDSNRILAEDLEVPERSPEIQAPLRKLFRLIENGQLAEARQLQQTLMAQIADSQYEGDLASADVLIRRKEILGR